MSTADYTYLNDHELIVLGLTLMKQSLQKIFDKDAQEHRTFGEYVTELERRGLYKEKEGNDAT